MTLEILQKEMIRLKRNLISLIIAITMSSGMLVVNPINVDASVDSVAQINASGTTNEYGLANDTSKGTILHAFSWSFNTIREHMKEKNSIILFICPLLRI